MAKVIRSVKHAAKGYSAAQAKVSTATSNDSWGPTGAEMSEIAAMTFNSTTDFLEIMDIIDKRLNDKGKNWRHVLKALKVLDYCLHEGSENVVKWARENIYLIRTLKEFQYIDDDRRDVGQTVRASAKELTALIMDEERLRKERSDRKLWKPRVTGLDEFGASSSSDGPNRSRVKPNTRRNRPEDDDTEMRLAMEASKVQAELDEEKRAKTKSDPSDADLEKAIKLSKEEEELRRRELQRADSSNIFDAPPLISLDNQGYEQGNQVDFGGNPLQQTMQPTGYTNGYDPNQQYQQYLGAQPTGFDPNMFQQNYTGQPSYMQQQNTAQLNNPYAAYTAAIQQQQQPQQQPISPQLQSPQQSFLNPGSHNPWAQQSTPEPLKPLPTGSKNPFAPASVQHPPLPNPNSLNSLSLASEPKSKSEFSSSFNPPVSFGTPQTSFATSQASPFAQQTQASPFAQSTSFTQKPANPQHAHLERLFADGGAGQDTFGNVGETRIPAQHTAPNTVVNSAGIGLSKLTAQATANNPFFQQNQFTGNPSQYGQGSMLAPAVTGPARTNNPYQRQQNGSSLIDF